MVKAIFNGRLVAVMSWMKGKGLVGKCPLCGSRMFPVVSVKSLMVNHWKHAKGEGIGCGSRCKLSGNAARQFYRLKATQRQIELDRKEKWIQLSKLYFVQVNSHCVVNNTIKGDNAMSKKSEQVNVETVVIPKWNYVSVEKGWLFEAIRSTEVKVDTVNTILYKAINGIDVTSETGVDLSKVNFTAMKGLMNWFIGNKELHVRALNMIVQHVNSGNTVSWKSEDIDCLPINGKQWTMSVSLYRYGNNREQTHVYFTINGVKSVFLRFVIMRNTINWLFDVKKFAGMAKLSYKEVKYRIGEGVGEVYDTEAVKPVKETADEFVQCIMDKPIQYVVQDVQKAMASYKPSVADNDDPF